MSEFLNGVQEQLAQCKFMGFSFRSYEVLENFSGEMGNKRKALMKHSPGSECANVAFLSSILVIVTQGDEGKFKIKEEPLHGVTN